MTTLSEIMSSRKWAITSIAGLQFYKYDDDDELVGRIRPSHSDRIQLVRRPCNRHDPNAVEIWWRDGRFQLGHIPRKEAAELAPLLDAGSNVLGFIWDGGNGYNWSAQIVLVHDDIPQDWHVRSVEDEARDLNSWMDRKLRTPSEAPSRPSSDEDQGRRRLDALTTLIPVLYPSDERNPPLPTEPPRSFRGKTLGWWDEIPENMGLMTKTSWGERGFNIKSRVRKPYCWIEYTTRRKRVRYALYASSQVTPKKLSDWQLAKKILRTGGVVYA